MHAEFSNLINRKKSYELRFHIWGWCPDNWGRVLDFLLFFLPNTLHLHIPCENSKAKQVMRRWKEVVVCNNIWIASMVMGDLFTIGWYFKNILVLDKECLFYLFCCNSLLYYSQGNPSLNLRILYPVPVGSILVSSDETVQINMWLNYQFDAWEDFLLFSYWLQLFCFYITLMCFYICGWFC